MADVAQPPTAPPPEAGPSTSPDAAVAGAAALPPLAELVKRGAKRTRVVYGEMDVALNDGLERA